jgi:glycosyltransferase involved in cell wall biosynthesis
LETAVAAVKFGKEVGVPVVLDVRDMWPDVLWHKTPPWAKSLVKCATIPWARLAKSACRGAFAIIGHAPAFMEWGLAHAGGPRTAFDRDFPLGYELSPPSPEEIAASEAFWASKGISRDSEQSIVCFIGTIGPHVQLDVILNAARLLNGKHQIQFVICGEGGQLEHYRQAANDLPNVLFPGWIERSPIWTLLHISKVALLSYIGRPDFIVSFPNKFAEYISAGLPIAIGYDSGIAYDLLVETNSGFSYHGSADELAIKLVDLLQSPDQLQQMSANATDLFLKRFQAEKVYGEMVVYLEEVARNSRRKVNH